MVTPSDTAAMDPDFAFKHSSSPSPHKISVPSPLLDSAAKDIDMNHFGDMLTGKTYTSDDSDGEKEEDKKTIVYYSFLNHKNNKDKFNDAQFAIEPRDKRIFRAKAVANQEKDLVRTLTLNIPRRDTRLTAVNSKVKNGNYERIDDENDLISSFNALIELKEEDECNDSIDSKQASRSPSPVQVNVAIESPKILTNEKVPLDNKKVLNEVVSEVSANNVTSVNNMNNKKKTKTKSKATSPVTTVPELSALSLRLNSLIGSGMLDTLHTIQDRLNIIDTLHAEKNDKFHQEVTLDYIQKIETSVLNSSIDCGLYDGSITTSSIAKSQWETYGKKAYTEEGIEVANLLLEKINLFYRSKMRKNSPKQQFKNENKGSILHSLKSLPNKAVSVATTYMKSTVSPSKKKKNSVHPESNVKTKQGKSKVFPYNFQEMDPGGDADSLSPNGDNEGVILMEYMHKLAIVEVSEESADVFLNCEVFNDYIDDVADIGGGDTVADISGGDTVIDIGGGDNLVDVGGGDTVADISGGDTVIDIGGGDNLVDVGECNTVVDISGGDNCVDAVIFDSSHNFQLGINYDIAHDADTSSISHNRTTHATYSLENAQVEQDHTAIIDHADELVDDIIDDDVENI